MAEVDKLKVRVGALESHNYLKELVDETLDGDITDVEYTTDDRLTDDDIRQYLRGHWQLEHPTDLQKKEKTVRNEILIEAIQYGAPLRQLSD